ncbi:bifunctional peptidase and arginyl-hydroxylase JMJD5 [Anabrus simplex]|uniref:bifunctional peptidase and arginyl-hydroxylase JMJD5 n=1 Tax=Anabrus simplex TaxID=316456 RepID=UPI0034DD356D
MDNTVAKISKLLPTKITDYLRDESIVDCATLLLKATSAVGANKSAQLKEGLQNIQAVLDFTWERLNIGHWMEVPVYQHQLYTLASLLKIVLLLQSHRGHSDVEVIREALHIADVGLIVGAPLELESGEGDLREVANILTLALNEIYHPLEVREPPVVEDNEEILSFESTGLKCQEIPQVHCPSLERFHESYFKPHLPAKLTGCISHWPALKLWTNMNYLVQRAGSRMVPVELGAHYVDPAWCQDFMTLSEFIVKHITSQADKVGYLAQHRLFDQVPELRADIFEPEYCCLGESEQGTDINAWFGPRGTVSPLHYDPKSNLLCQVVGSKRVLLFAPQESCYLYPHEQDPITNTARVDPEQPDYSSFPEFKKAQGWECCLNPGEILFIPPRWWHYVRSLTTSFSVSFWWE